MSTKKGTYPKGKFLLNDLNGVHLIHLSTKAELNIPHE
ncbi:hypothetical protein M23134_03356 [Microscilla marina ATCC 23134]|uniref:Uncharacterized protein n=1 Tax=Microscilla marina ATCC 23134 TaxID=313606 RepID=A1ZV04_MICM2|nr:hypothetical protein M23134_03356 [Microscilla marina ATCC 23134]